MINFFLTLFISASLPFWAMVAGQSSYCDPVLGCFYLNGSVAQFGVVPELRDQVNTSFYAFRKDDPDTPLEVYANDSSTFAFIDSSQKLFFLTSGFTGKAIDLL